MNLWTETPKGKRAMKAVAEIGPEMSLNDARRVVAAIRFLNQRVGTWQISIWPGDLGTTHFAIDAVKYGSNLERRVLGDGTSIEWTLIEAVCTVLDVEAADRRREAGGE